MIIYSTETITNNGIISMTARGAYAKGQNVYLFKDKDGSFEFVPKAGGAGSKTAGLAPVASGDNR